MKQVTDMEIERKWMVKSWPDNLTEDHAHFMRQGYISVRPTVRIREEALFGGETAYILCFKSAGRLARKEIEMEIAKDKFAELEDLIGCPLIAKLRKTYRLSDGHFLEVSLVDEGAPTAFMYAEVEFGSIEEALGWNGEDVGLGAYLSDEVTNEPGQSMGAYWLQTRGEAGAAGPEG